VVWYGYRCDEIAFRDDLRLQLAAPFKATTRVSSQRKSTGAGQAAKRKAPGAETWLSSLVRRRPYKIAAAAAVNKHNGAYCS